jgi:O-antigen/teichoic acid export membrane protein
MRGLAWVGASQVSISLIRLGVAVVVARLLGPGEYGLAMLALVFQSLVLIFSDMALGAALVQRKRLTDRDKSTAFWIAVGSGVAFTGIGVALSGPMAALYGQPDMQPLLAVLSASFLLTALGSTHQALLMREMNFGRLEPLTVGGALAGGVVAVVLAALGTGAWAIIAQQLGIAAVVTILAWKAAPWRPKLVFSRASLRDLASFSAYLVGHRLLYYVQQNADRFLIGRFVGTPALGAYAIAYNIILAPATRLGQPLQRVLAPAFSRIQDEPERIAAAWARVARLLAVLAVPGLLGMIVVAPDFVAVVLGDEWSSAVALIQILAWVGILQAIQSVDVDILVARDRTATVFRFTAAFTLTHLVSFTIGLQWGIVGMAVAYAVSATLIQPFLTVLTARALGVSPWIFVRSMSGVFQAALVMCAAVYAARMGMVDGGLDAGVRLVLCIALGALVFVPLCAWREPALREEARSVMRRLAPRIGVAGRAAGQPAPARTPAP